MLLFGSVDWECLLIGALGAPIAICVCLYIKVKLSNKNLVVD